MTALQRAIIVTLVAVPPALLYAALHARGPAPAAPAPPTRVVVVAA